MNKAMIKGVILAIMAAVFWGVSGTFGQFLFQERGINVEWLITVRMLVSGIILLLYAKLSEKTKIFEIWSNKGDIIQLLIFSIAGMLSVQYTYFAAIKYSNAATATILQFCGPIIITIYISIKLRKIPEIKETLAILLATTGTILLVTHGNFHKLAISNTAFLFGLCSAIALAIYTLQPIKLLSKHTPSVVIGWGMFCGGLVFSFIKTPWDVEGHWDLLAYLYTGAIILFGTLIAFTFYLNSVKIIGGQKASLLASAEPLAATILAVYWLQTPFSSIDWVGSLFIISTVFY